MRAALESMGVFSLEVVLTPEPRVAYLSPGLSALLAPDEATQPLTAQCLFNLIAAEPGRDRTPTPDDWAALVETPRAPTLQRAANPPLTLQLHGVVERDAGGQPVRIHGAVRESMPSTQALEALHESEARYETLIETAPFGVLLHRDGEVLEINPAARKIFGIPADTPATEIQIQDYFDPAEISRLRAFGERRAAGLPTPSQYESRAHLPTGERRDLLVGAQRVATQGLPSTLVSIIDISDRKRAEEELADSRERFQSIVECAPEGMFVEHDGLMVYANEACRRLLGVDLPNEVIGMRLRELVDEAKSDAWWRNEEPEDAPVQWARFRGKGGQAPARELEIATMQGDFAGLPATFGIVRDISKQVGFQRNLEARVSFEGLLCQLSTQFINVQADEVEEVIQDALEQIGAVAGADRCFVTLITPDLRRVVNGFAWAREGVDSHADIIKGESLDAFPYAARCLLEDQLLYVPSVAELPEEAGPERTLFERQGVLSTVVLPLYSEGEWRGFFGMETTRMQRQWSDEEISSLRLAAQVFSYAVNRKHNEVERERLAMQIQTAQKMETLGVLAGGIAHDFNNLLTAILGNASVALQELPEDATARECVSEMERAAQHAAQLVRQMLLYAGRGKSSKRVLDLNRLVEDIAQLLRTSIGKKAELKYELAEQPPSVLADETQLRQIVMNLITNASQALEERPGAVHLRTGGQVLERGELRRAYLGSEASPGDFAYIEVEDSGCGMTPEVVERMFDPFFTSKKSGTGLGLAATLGIVRTHKGVIELETAPNKGTRIRVSLPLAKKGAGTGATVARPVESESKVEESCQILIVDDEPVVRAVARRILERGGYGVVEAVNGEEGVQRFQDANGDIHSIVMDMAMPVMDGEQAFLAIRASGPAVPVVFSSGYLVRETIDRLLQEPATAFVGKPYRPNHLLTVLGNLLTEAKQESAESS